MGAHSFYFSEYNSDMEKIVKTLEEFEAEAARFVRGISGPPSPEATARRSATLVTLSGELGAGKTAFTKAVARELGVTDVVNSPTFVLEKIYVLPLCELGSSTPKFARLVHIDAYRLESGKDLAALSFDELMCDPSNLILFEWPEMVKDGLPPASVAISIATRSDGSRTISYA